MRQKHAEDVYQFAVLFAEEFILKGNSILTDDPGVLTEVAINNCIERFITNSDTSGSDFEEKVKKQFDGADRQTCTVFAHAEWLWAYAVEDLNKATKQGYVKRILILAGVEEIELNEVFAGGFGRSGQSHKTNKYLEIKYVLLLIYLLQKKVASGEISTQLHVFEWMEKTTLFQKYGIEDADFTIDNPFFKKEMPSRRLAISNIICYITFPDKYERISSDSHKQNILNSFGSLISEDPKGEITQTDEKIYSIRKTLGKLTNRSNFDFYDDQFLKVWNYSLLEEGFSEIQGLQFKKAIILYGPPGTSKTYSAKRLAEAIITHAFLQKKDNVAPYFKGEIDFLGGRVHHLQLHANYSYEDFVAGLQLSDHTVSPVRGKLFDICNAAEKDKVNGMPHVLILDEINRIDLSRLFGEVFSALENREEPIEVSIGGFKLTIPDNLYVIGTMNEIDFSLERIDFALRRRFLWFFYGFDPDVLKAMIDKTNKILRTQISEEEIIRFIDAANRLNKAISELSELGKAYQIGHTFFAEVVNIYESYKILGGYTNRIKNKIFRSDGAVNILWDISIEPILAAFLGSMDRDTKTTKLNELRSIYFDK